MKIKIVQIQLKWFVDYEVRVAPKGWKNLYVCDSENEALDVVDTLRDQHNAELVAIERDTTFRPPKQWLALRVDLDAQGPFDAADFQRNPLKYTKFKAATIAESITSSPALVAGKQVHIRYFMTQQNIGRGNQEMPVYEVRTGDDPDLDLHPSYLYACALKDFKA